MSTDNPQEPDVQQPGEGVTPAEQPVATTTEPAAPVEPAAPAEPVVPTEPEVPAAPVAEAPEGTSLAEGLEIGSQAAPETPEERPEPVVRGKMDRFGVAWGTGRRKTSVARVRILDGSGDIVVNGRSFDEYFLNERDRHTVLKPLEATGMRGKVEVRVRVSGGGTTGQTGAVVLGIARALEAKNPELHHQLSEGGFLTRDGRMVERKKYGFKKARRSFQFSKR